MLRAALFLFPTLLGITIVTFLIVNLAPGDPVESMNRGQMDARISPESYYVRPHRRGLDDPTTFATSPGSSDSPPSTSANSCP